MSALSGSAVASSSPGPVILRTCELQSAVQNNTVLVHFPTSCHGSLSPTERLFCTEMLRQTHYFIDLFLEVPPAELQRSISAKVGQFSC